MKEAIVLAEVPIISVNDLEIPQLKEEQSKVKGKFHIEIFRAATGQTEVYDLENLVTNEGVNYLFGVGFHADAAITAWFFGLMDNATFSANAVTDAMASHAGWTEYTAFSEATRQAWAVDAPATRAIGNTAPATFTINAPGNLRGVFITSSSTKGGTAGKLWSSVLFTAVVPVAAADVIKITYSVSA